jgi:hypothetical protein
MERNPYILRCYARPEKDYIIGICIDLDIAVRSDSISQVREEMRKAIEGYFLSLDKDNFKDLFPRTVPFHVKLDYYRVCCLIKYLRFFTSFKRNFQVFCEQLIPEKFSIAPCV